MYHQHVGDNDRTPNDFISSASGATYCENNTGLSDEPCGTPASRLLQLDVLELKLTNAIRRCKYDQNQLGALPDIPNVFLSN